MLDADSFASHCTLQAKQNNGGHVTSQRYSRFIPSYESFKVEDIIT